MTNNTVAAVVWRDVSTISVDISGLFFSAELALVQSLFSFLPMLSEKDKF